jgi:hypothetical protein
MVKTRNCAWLGESQPDSKIIWARAGIVAKQCPKSVVTAGSLRYLDIYRNWKVLGPGCSGSLDAKSADAIELLEQKWKAEYERAKQK